MLSRKDAKMILKIFSTHLQENYYQKVILTLEHYLQAKKLLASFQYQLYSLDALHLSIAVAENIPLVTLDKDLSKTAKKIKSNIIDIH